MTGDTEFIKQKHSEYQTALEKSKKLNQVEIPSYPRLDAPSQDPKSAAINQRMRASLENDKVQQASLSNETIEGLKKLAEETKKLEDEELASKTGVSEDDDDYIYDDYGNKIRNLHNNRKRRKAIEARCSEMDIADLLINQYVEQTVPIISEESRKFVVTFRSLSGHEDLLIKSLMAREAHHANQISSWYMIGKFSMLRLAAGLVKINGRTLQDIKGPDGKPDEKLLLQKFQYIANFPNDILTDLDVNYIWFSERVKELSVADNIINF